MYRYLLECIKKAERNQPPPPASVSGGLYYHSYLVAIEKGLIEMKEGNIVDFKVTDLHTNTIVFDTRKTPFYYNI